jgi:protein involved in polysaccharide export with SLBB domain
MQGFMKKQTSRWARGIVIGVGSVIVSTLFVAGCASTDQSSSNRFSDPPPDLFPTNAVPNAGGTGVSVLDQKGDRLRIGDRVTVKFAGTTDQTLPQKHEEDIKDDGTITLPHILQIKAAGKTLGELQNEIHDRYVPDYYKRLTVTVTGEQRVYYVGGQVKTPGRQMYIDATTVTKAIQSAGDFTDFAAKRRVELTRTDGKKFIIDCEKATRDSALDLPVYPGDKIHVPQRGWREIFG